MRAIIRESWPFRGGIGAASHLAGELFKREADIDILHVPYKGDGATFPDLLAGRVSMMLGTNRRRCHWRKVVRCAPSALTTKDRSALAPDIPTLAEIRGSMSAPGPACSPPHATADHRAPERRNAENCDRQSLHQSDRLGTDVASSTPEALGTSCAMMSRDGARSFTAPASPRSNESLSSEPRPGRNVQCSRQCRTLRSNFRPAGVTAYWRGNRQYRSDRAAAEQAGRGTAPRFSQFQVIFFRNQKISLTTRSVSATSARWPACRRRHHQQDHRIRWCATTTRPQTAYFRREFPQRSNPAAPSRLSAASL